MKSLRDLSIRSKLTLMMMMTSVLALAVAAITWGVFDSESVRKSIVDGSAAKARIVASTAADSLLNTKSHIIHDVLGELSADAHLMAAAVFDKDGRRIAEYLRSGEPSMAIPPGTSELRRINADSLEVTAPVLQSGQTIGIAYLKFDLEELRARREASIRAGIITLAVAGIIAFIFAKLVQRAVSKPLLELSEMSRVVTEFRDYSRRAVKHGNDEVGRFIDHFNQMLGEIQQRDADLQDARTDLEQRVWERTKELIEANKQLNVEIGVARQAREESEVLSKQLAATVEHLRTEIAERTEAQEALSASEERFSKAFKSSPVPLALISRRTRKFIDANDRFAGLIGQPTEVVIGCTISDTALCADAETRSRLGQIFEKGETASNWQCVIGRGKNRQITALLSAETLTLGNEPVVLLMIEDISERLELETKLRHSQKMDAIGQLASGVAHDFNNLLTIIQGHTQMVLAGGRCAEPDRKSLDKAISALQRAAQLTRQLLTFSRKQVVQLKSLDLNQVVNNVTTMLGPLLGESIRLKLQPAENVPAIEADAGMLEQVIVNLAVNARDAMPRGGELTLSTTVREIDAAYTQSQPQARPGTFVCLKVSDTGCGMDAATLERIFEPFFTTKGVGKGTGLGLATVYGITKQHQGWVEVTSKVGVGTTFSVFLPAVGVNAPAAEHTDDTGDVAGGHEGILVVEDEPLLRELVSQVLREAGYNVLEAQNGKEALSIWQNASRKPDLLLTDMVMPEGLTGAELADQLRTQEPRLKVIYTSGYSTELLAQKGSIDQLQNFLPKPYNPKTLARTVRECLDQPTPKAAHN